jgi:hypothetical protein
MKKIFITFLVLCPFIINAQTPSTIRPLFQGGYAKIENAYYKDIDLDFDAFLGTWRFTEGNTILEIKLQKVLENYNANNKVYEDVIIGEYRYVENGIELVNTIQNLNAPFVNHNAYQITGSSIVKPTSAPICPECDPNERRIKLSFSDPIRNAPGLTGRITLRRVDENGVQKIHMRLQQTGTVLYLDETPVTYLSFHVPWGQYVLTKQP